MARPLDFRSSEGLERTMRSLLRTPKTRSGLFAVAKKHGVGRNWVYGWVANAEASNIVRRIGGTSKDPLYVIASAEALIVSAGKADYPSWMSPPPPPPYLRRKVYRVVGDDPVPKLQHQEDID